MSNQKILILLLICSILPLASIAETKETRSTQKHEVHIGYGDPMYETMRWRDEPNKLGVPMNARQNYHYTGHIYGEYMYRVNSWLGVGAQLDFGATMFDYNSYQLDAKGNQFLASSQYRFLPEVTYVYLPLQRR